MLFLLVVGGAAVLEVHRAMNAGNKDTRELKRREDELRRQLQVRGLCVLAGGKGGATPLQAPLGEN